MESYGKHRPATLRQYWAVGTARIAYAQRSPEGSTRGSESGNIASTTLTTKQPGLATRLLQ